MKSAARRTASASRRRSSTRPTRSERSAGRTRCWRPRRTTPSAARMRGRGSPSCRNVPTNGARQVSILEPPSARAARRRRGPRAARPQRRIHALSDARRLLADRHAGQPEPEAHEAYQRADRGALEKSMREAKRRSSWTAPNAEYEEAMRAFAREALSPEGDGFLSSFPAVRAAGRAARRRRTASCRRS